MANHRSTAAAAQCWCNWRVASLCDKNTKPIGPARVLCEWQVVGLCRQPERILFSTTSCRTQYWELFISFTARNRPLFRHYIQLSSFTRTCILYGLFSLFAYCVCWLRKMREDDYARHCVRKGKERKRIYTAPLLKYLTLKALRYRSHSVTCKLHRTCLYLVSIHQMAHPHTEVVDIWLQPTTHLSTPKGWNAELAWVAGYIMRQFICPKAVTNPSTNPARCRATALIETNTLPLHQTATPKSRSVHDTWSGGNWSDINVVTPDESSAVNTDEKYWLKWSAMSLDHVCSDSENDSYVTIITGVLAQRYAIA